MSYIRFNQWFLLQIVTHVWWVLVLILWKIMSPSPETNESDEVKKKTEIENAWAFM